MSFPRLISVATAVVFLPGLALSATCLTYAPTTFPDTGTCVNAQAHTSVGATFNIGNPTYGPSSVSVLAGQTDLDAHASAFAGPGLLRLSAFASDGGSDVTSVASARAQAGFSDMGRIGLPGAKLGDPVHGTVTVAIGGVRPAMPELDRLIRI